MNTHIEPFRKVTLFAPPDDKLNRAAVHEAGHGVAAWECCYVIDIGEIRIWEAGHGLTTNRFHRASEGVSFPKWEQIVVGLAGMAGELRVYGSVYPNGSLPDFQTCRFMAEGIVGLAPMARGKWDISHGLPLPDVASLLRQEAPEDVRLVLNICLARALKVIGERRLAFRRLRRTLVRRRRVGPPELSLIFGGNRDSF